MLGLREPEKYGAATLDDLEALCAETAEALGLAIDFRQTNAEGELINWVQECRGRAAGIVINPAGYTPHSSARADPRPAARQPPPPRRFPPPLERADGRAARGGPSGD